MSTRAYKLIEIKTEEEPSFNYTHHYEFIDKFVCTDDNDSVMCIYKDDLQNMQQYIKDNDFSDIEETKDECIEIYNNIKKDMGTNEYVEYYLF